jgi:hypothetical protein
MTWSASRQAKAASLSFVMPGLDTGISHGSVKESSAIKDLIALDPHLVRGDVGGCCGYTSNSHIASPSDRSVPSP